ncbi:hypothetical protein SO802_024818 [Lithocarpus litseifolius]|uniref:FLZ-type domain-containing protein n=1 Tax=Lithocarpus litseifolius TaxID=425828 RepID=A0AAW2CFH6_9ROSI
MNPFDENKPYCHLNQFNVPTLHVPKNEAAKTPYPLTLPEDTEILEATEALEVPVEPEFELLAAMDSMSDLESYCAPKNDDIIVPQNPNMSGVCDMCLNRLPEKGYCNYGFENQTFCSIECCDKQIVVDRMISTEANLAKLDLRDEPKQMKLFGVCLKHP